jgi:hypothetical protein
MHAVAVEQRTRRVVITLALDPLHLGEQPADALAKRPRIGHHEKRPAVTAADVDRRRVCAQPVHDQVAVAHVVFFDRRTGADAP